MTWRRRGQSAIAAAVLREAWYQRGWRRSTLLFSLAALLTFSANLAFTLWAVTTHDVTEGVGVIVEKDCADIKKLNSGVHVLINALSTVLLAGSNYCMQCLSAPTRSQVDNAHKSRRWMDIGVSSLRNIFSGEMDGRRVGLWLLLGLSSLPLHLFYNSAVFQSVSANAYNVWLMNEDWINSGNTSSINGFTTTNFGDRLEPLRTAISQGRLQRLDTAACVDAYAVPFQSSHSDLVLVAAGQEPVFGLMQDPDSARLRLDTMDNCGSTQAYQWMCAQYKPQYSFCNTLCDQLLPSLHDASHAGTWKPFEHKAVEYCYSLPSEEHCKLQFSRDLLVTVVVLNLFKAALMFACAFGWRDEPPLLTVGDAIASFVEWPDESTEDMCLLTRDAVATAWTSYAEQRVCTFDDQRRRRFKGASPLKWTTIVLLLATAIILCLYLLFYGINKMKGKKDAATIFGLGLGAVDSKTLMATAISADAGGTSLLQNVVLANTPQLVFSLVYFSYNGIFTTMSLATEWSRFAIPGRRKGLRRSGGLGGVLRGAQRSAYFLQLPYRLALPLIVVSGALHWLISQSIFLVYVEAYIADITLHGPTVHSYGLTHRHLGFDKDVVTCGWSPVAVVSAVVVGVAMVVLLVAFGLRRLPTGMPVVGSCSAAIAAACHPPFSEQDSMMSEKPLQWGETLTANSDGPGHCSFSAGEVTYPNAGARYL